MMSDRVMMNVFSVLKSRTSTAGFSGVIIVESSCTGNRDVDEGEGRLHDRLDRLVLDLRIAHELVIEMRLVE